jgi:hypothetical protein
MRDENKSQWSAYDFVISSFTAPRSLYNQQVSRNPHIVVSKNLN